MATFWTGHVLIADLDLTDPNFHRSVVLVLDHTADGAFGLVVNRPLGLTAAQIVLAPDQSVVDPDRRTRIPLYGGGPVETQAVFALHTGFPTGVWTSDQARVVVPGLWFEPSFPALQAYVTGQSPELPPDDIPNLRLYLGYAGWGAGQLEAEIEEGSWQLTRATLDLVLAPADEVWLRAMERKGGYWSIVAQTGFKPSLN